MLADKGVKDFEGDKTPILSHICFKFNSQSDYLKAVDSAHQLGEVKHQEFKGKQITWCKLNTPFEKGSLKLEWLELVEPKKPNTFNGVTSVGYCVPNLKETVKIVSPEESVIFRYQSKHASEYI